MKKALFLLIASSLFTACATPAPTKKSAGSNWQCTAQNLISANYDGGSDAYVHLSPYSYGGNYSVTKNADGSATGTTANGTKFTCTKK